MAGGSDNTRRPAGAGASDTIGLFGGSRSSASAQFGSTRSSRYRRLGQIVEIVSHYDVARGLTPEGLRLMLQELGPTFVKAGQILSMRSEILPQSFCDELSKLRTNVEPMPYETVLAALREEYDRPLEEIFDAIEPEPLGSASVAQVHIARLVDGTDVAVKVQRPRVREVMAQDIDIMRSIARRASHFLADEQFLDVRSVIEELWTSFREETDFNVEARNLHEFGEDNADVRFVTCPRPYLDLCTEHVVVMEYVRGIPIYEVDALREAGYDLDEIGTKLVDNYARQILDVGFFHADPHPGNLIISGGKIAFIDLGMMGRLSAHDRGAIRDIVFAVAERDSSRLKDGLLRFSVNTDTTEVDHARLLSDLDAIVDDFGTQSLSELDLGAFVSAVVQMARKNGIELPGTVTMLARSLVTLEGVLDEFIPSVSMIDIIRGHLKAHETPSQVLSDEARQTALESRAALHGVLGAASESRQAMRMLTRGQLTTNIRIAGSEDLVSDLAHAANRLTMGIVVAGLFIGSSVVYYARIRPVIFGIPIIGFLGYFVALGIGLWIVWDIMRERRRR